MVLDPFARMYELQKMTQEFFRDNGAADSAALPNNPDVVAVFKANVLLMIKEVAEVLDEVDFKKHRKDDNSKAINKYRIREELIDVMKYWFNLCILLDIKPDELFITFEYKTDKVIERYEREFLDAKV